MPVETEVDQSERVIKLEIALTSCEYLRDVLAKVMKKLAPFTPIEFIEVTFNNKRISTATPIKVAALSPESSPNGCLYCSVRIDSRLDDLTLARLAIEDKRHREKGLRPISLPNYQRMAFLRRGNFDNIDNSDIPECRPVFQPSAKFTPESLRNPQVEYSTNDKFLMPGDVFNLVPDVLEDPSSISSSSVDSVIPVIRESRNFPKMRKLIGVRQSNDNQRRLHDARVSEMRNDLAVTFSPSHGLPLSSKKVAIMTPMNMAANTTEVKGRQLVRRVIRNGDQKKPVVLPSFGVAYIANKYQVQNHGVHLNRNSMNNAVKVPGQSSDGTSWVEDTHFQRMMEMNGIPRDPEQWNETQVQIWIRWASKHFGFNKERSEVLQKIHGGNLMCDLPAQEIVRMVECPPDVADVFLIHLKLLREKRVVAVPQDDTNANSRNNPTSANPSYRVLRGGNNVASGISGSRLVTPGITNSSGLNGTGRMRGYGRGHLAPVNSSSSLVLSTIQQPFGCGGTGGFKGNAGVTVGSSAPLRRSIANGESGINNGSLASSSTGNNSGQPQLWQFLLDLLTDWKYYNDIQWNTDDGEFKLMNPERVAQAWGIRKNKPTMNYEKLSRALRYYYDGDMLAKVQGKKFVYKFVCNLKHLLGYEAKDLRRLVEKSALNHRDELERSRASMMYSMPSNLSNSSSTLSHLNSAKGGGPIRGSSSSNRFLPYSTPHLNINPQCGIVPSSRQLLHRSRIQVTHSVTSNPTLFEGEHNVAMTSEVPESQPNISDNSPFLSSQMGDRWRCANSSGSLWSSNDISAAEASNTEAEEVCMDPKMPVLHLAPVSSTSVSGINSAANTASISPIKFLNSGVSSDVVLNAAVEADLTQFLSGGYPNNGDLTRDVSDDIELDNFLSFDEKTVSTSPTRLIQPNTTRQVVGVRNGVLGSNMGNIAIAGGSLPLSSSGIDSAVPHTGNSNVSSSEPGHDMSTSFDSDSMATGLDITTPQRRGLGLNAFHGNEISVSVPGENGVGIATDENCLGADASADGLQYHHVGISESVVMPENEGDTSLLNPFLEASGPDTELIDSDHLDGWP